MELLKSCHGSLQPEEPQDRRQKPPEFERSDGATGSASELRFEPQHQDHQQVEYRREQQHRQEGPPFHPTGQQQFSMESIRNAAPPSSLSHYHHHHHRHLSQQQHQLLPGHPYFINDLLSATATSNSISPPDISISSSMQLLKGKIYLSQAISLLYIFFLA